MIQILINNEEVVCDKNLKINEEMLTTSSIILDNVYPKSWESTHDYITNFYYPKDFSLCTINDIQNIQPDPGTTVTGQTISLNYDNTKQWEYEMLGNANQETTKGNQLIDYSELIPIGNQVTYTWENDVLTVSNTTSSYRYAYLNILDLIKNNAGKVLRLDYDSIDFSQSNAPSVNLEIINNGTTSYQGLINSTGGIYYYSIPNDTSGITRARLRFMSNNSSTSQAGTIIITKPMLHFGGAKMTFEPYTGGVPAPNQSYPYPVKTTTGENVINVSGNNTTQSHTVDLGSIELCKIDTYQDYIYKNGSTWYKHSELGKVVFDGSEEGWSLFNNNARRASFYIPLQNVKRPATTTVNSNLLSNYFTSLAENDTWTAGTISLRTVNDNLYLNVTSGTTLANFKTWLSTHNTTVYYPLATPIEEEITDETLISQLNAINLFNGENNITITGDIAGILQIHYNFVNGGQTVTQLFAGMVMNTGNISLNPRYPHYCSVQVLSFSDFLSIGDTLDFVISEKTVLEAIQMIINTIAPYGFVLGNVNIYGADDVIGAYSTQEKTAYDVFNYLADITGSRWTTRMINEHTIAIDFYDPSLMPQGTGIDYTQQWFEQYDIEDITFNYGTRDYRNKQVMLSDEVYADIDYTETIIADGYNKTFLTTANIGSISKIYVNGVEATFVVKADEEIEVEADFYYTIGKNELESDTTYTAGTQISITYTPLVQGRQVIYNHDEVTRVAGQTERKGVIARYENRNDVTSSDELVKIGQSYLKYKGSPEVNLMVKTTQNIWEIGQTVYFHAPLQELTTDYMVKSKETLILPINNKVFYTYKMVSSFNSENAINYFDNQRSKNAGNISQGDFITRNIDLENSALIIFNNASATEITVAGDNVLNSGLNFPLRR